MRRSFSYRANCNKATVVNADRFIELNRQLYNAALEQRIFVWKQRNRSITLFDQINELPELKKAFPEFALAGADAIEEPLKRLNLAFQHFFRRVKQGQKPGFPRFKGKDRYNSFTLRRSCWKIEGKHLIVQGIGTFKLFLSRPIEGTVKTVTVKRSSRGKWFVSFSCDSVPARSFPVTKKVVGIDVGIKSFAVDSDGVVTDNPRHLKTSLAELRRKQRTLARRIRGSNRRKVARLAVARVYERVTNQRKDFINKLANHYVRHYQTIHIENLNIQGMIRNRHLSRSIADASWGLFFNRLSQVAAEAQRELVKVNPSGTTQLCSQCGEKVPKILANRVHSCFNCGLVLDRDLNAALNIKSRGHRIQASTPVMLADVA